MIRFEALLRDRGRAALALALQGLFALSEMYPRGEGMGMAMLVRQVEDKFVALLVVLPLAQAAFLAAMRGRGRRAPWVFGLLAVELAVELELGVTHTVLLGGGLLAVGLFFAWRSFYRMQISR